jgi:hypothetical protein
MNRNTTSLNVEKELRDKLISLKKERGFSTINDTILFLLDGLKNEQNS